MHHRLGRQHVLWHLDWNYKRGYVDVSMNNYVKRALDKFTHAPPLRPQHAPHAWQEPTYGKRGPQSPTTTTNEPALNNDEAKIIQSTSGKFNYYSDTDPCIKPALNEIASEQAKPTFTTKRRTEHLLDYFF